MNLNSSRVLPCYITVKPARAAAGVASNEQPGKSKRCWPAIPVITGNLAPASVKTFYLPYSAGRFIGLNEIHPTAVQNTRNSAFRFRGTKSRDQLPPSSLARISLTELCSLHKFRRNNSHSWRGKFMRRSCAAVNPVNASPKKFKQLSRIKTGAKEIFTGEIGLAI